jgi:hypothetical protein
VKKKPSKPLGRKEIRKRDIQVVILRKILLWKIQSAVFIWRALGLKPPTMTEAEQLVFIQAVEDRLHDDILPEQRLAGKLLIEFCAPSWRFLRPDLIGLFVERDSPEARSWRKAIIVRDGRCRACGSTESLHAHHIVPWVVSSMLRLVMDNGITLCRECHIVQHRNMVKAIWI